MYQHIRDEPPRLVSFMRVVDKEFGDGSVRLCLPVSSIIAEEDDLHQGDEDHADGGRPAAVFLLVSSVCVGEDGFATGGRGRCLVHNTIGGTED